MEIITSWDDGHKEDLKIATLLEKYNLPGIFYIPTLKSQLSQEDLKALDNCGFIIGGHTLSHPEDLKRLTPENLKTEIELNKQLLQGILGHDIKDFCYPRGRYNEDTIKAVKEAGYATARTTLVGNTDTGFNLYRIPTTVHVHPSRKEYGGKNWLEYAKEKFMEARAKDGYFHLWGHSWEIEKLGLWNDLNNLLKYIYEQRPN